MKKVVSQRVVFAKPNVMLGALAAAISACYAPQTFSAEKATRQMDEVIVTARRRDEMAQDVPISMTVMTEDFLEKNNIEKVEDLGTKVPSMRITQVSGSMNEPVVTLRGQRQGEASFNQDPAAPIYFNEIVMSPIQGSNMGLYDLEGVQVLKGPQGTLFGRNSTGGAVMMTSKRPGYKLGGYAEVKVGNYDLYGFEGAVDVPLFEGLTSRLAIHKLDRDGYQKNIANNSLYGKRYRDEHSEGARLSLNFENDALSNLLVFSYDENNTAAAIPIATKTNTSVGIPAYAPFVPLYAQYVAGAAEQVARDNPWKVKSDIDGKENARNIFASDAFEYNLKDDLTVKNVFGYRKVFLASGADVDGTESPILGSPPFAGSTDPRLTTIDTEFYSDELQLFGSAFDNNLDWITGLYWSRMAGTEDKKTMQGGPTSLDIALNDAINTSYGLFVEGTYAFTDEWALTVGARQSQEEREMTVRKWSDYAHLNCIIFAEGALPPSGAKAPGCERNVSETFESTTWKTSVNFTPAPNVLLYGSISTGYRAGGFNTRGTYDSTLQPFDPENVLTYELGHKQDWDLGGIPIRSSLAAYFQDYEDIQNTVSFFEGGKLQTRTQNASKAEIKGLELELTVKPTDDLTWAVSYSYVDAKYKNKTDNLSVTSLTQVTTVFATNVDTSGNAFPYIPEQSLTSSLTYVLPLDAALGEISLMAGVYWQDKMSTHPLKDQFPLYGANNPAPWTAANIANATELSEVDSYTVWNFRVDWHGVMGSAFDVAAYVDNATDEEYVLGGLNVIEGGGFAAYHYGAPRTFGASLKYSF